MAGKLIYIPALLIAAFFIFVIIGAIFTHFRRR